MFVLINSFLIVIAFSCFSHTLKFFLYLIRCIMLIVFWNASSFCLFFFFFFRLGYPFRTFRSRENDWYNTRNLFFLKKLFFLFCCFLWCLWKILSNILILPERCFLMVFLVDMRWNNYGRSNMWKWVWSWFLFMIGKSTLKKYNLQFTKIDTVVSFVIYINNIL